MNHTTSSRAVAASAALAIGALALSSCSMMGDALRGQATQSYKDAAEFAKDAPLKVDWLPSDATDITLRTSSDVSKGDAVVLLKSGEQPPSSCRVTQRHSAPTLMLDGSPDVYDSKNSTIRVCGAWSVMKSATGWYGWTPNTEDRSR